MNRITRALRHRNYRLFFGGHSISLIGTWITRIATSWRVYRRTGSELLLGVVGFGTIFCLADALWLAVKRPMRAAYIRPIYIERGIIDIAAEEVR